MSKADDTDLLHFIRTASGLEPADEKTVEAMQGWKIGQHLRCDMVRARSIERLRWYWGLCRVVLDNSSDFITLEDVSNSIKLGTGHHVITQVWENGQWRIDRAPGSIAIRNMDDGPWRVFERRAADYACTVLSVSSAQLEEALFRYIAPNYNR